MAKAKSTTSKTSKMQKETTTTSAPAVSAAPVAAVDNVRSISSGLATKNPGVTKAETRANVATTALQDEIRRRAYELYKERGYSTGNETEDWLVAEREVMQRHQHHQQQSA